MRPPKPRLCDGRSYVAGKDEVKLTVAHVSEDKMEMIQPVTVTNSHVTINIQSLSRFGLTIPSKRSQLRAQVLLFYKKITQHNVIELHVHLLPVNVPLKEVLCFNPYFCFYRFLIIRYTVNPPQ